MPRPAEQGRGGQGSSRPRSAPEPGPARLSTIHDSGGVGHLGIGHQLDLRALGVFAGDRHPGLHLQALRATMLSPGASSGLEVDQAAFQGEVLPIAAVAAAHGLDRAHRRAAAPAAGGCRPPASRASRAERRGRARHRADADIRIHREAAACCAGAGICAATSSERAGRQHRRTRGSRRRRGTPRPAPTTRRCCAPCRRRQRHPAVVALQRRRAVGVEAEIARAAVEPRRRAVAYQAWR